jgi:hypothetical protein
MTAMKDASMNTNMHSAFKREILRLREGLLKADLSDARAAGGLARRYTFFSATLHRHHEAEDTSLASVLAAVDEDVKALSAQSDKGQISARLDELRTVLSIHTQHEEQEGIPIVQKYLEEDDFKAFVTFSREGEDASLVLPWVSDGATPAEVASTWGMIPGPVRLFVKPMLTRKYTRFTQECGV